jgi:gluconolactonase
MEARLLASNLGFTEGPVFRQRGDYAVVSLDQGRVYAISPEGVVSVLADTGLGPNGLVEDADGTLYVAQCGLNYVREAQDVPEVMRKPPGSISGAIQAIRPDGSIEVISQDPYMPNDLCFGPDGYLYVTDPTRSAGAPSFRADGRIWRFDVHSGECELMKSVGWFPNGIGFGLESDALYAASTAEDRIYRLALTHDGFAGLGAEEVAIQLERGSHPDGFAFDVEGNLIIATNHKGVQVWSPDGRLLDVFTAGSGRYGTNVAIDHTGRMLICDGGGCAVLVADGWSAPGLALHPFRQSHNAEQAA